MSGLFMLHSTDSSGTFLNEYDSAHFEGLTWKNDWPDQGVQWTQEPEIAAIMRTLQERGFLAIRKIRYLAKGFFNKVYEVETSNMGSVIMRVTLPVDPYYKTASERATLAWIKEISNIPVPVVLDCDSSRLNPIGFEWMLETKIAGRPYADMWREMSFEAKHKIVVQLAQLASDNFRNQLRGIGNIYDDKTASGQPPEVGRIVSMTFLWDEHIHYDVPRGPFRNARDWLMTMLVLQRLDCANTLTELARNQADIDDPDFKTTKLSLLTIQKLEALTDRLLLRNENTDDLIPTILRHDDLNKHNIYVDDAGNLTGVLDWECVTAVPLWAACDVPKFLTGCARDKKPEKDAYNDRVSGDLDSIYWDDLEEYECTKLRQFFLDTMEQMEPGWIVTYRASQMLRDLESAVQMCRDQMCARAVRKWLGDVGDGDGEGVLSLQERIWPAC